MYHSNIKNEQFKWLITMSKINNVFISNNIHTFDIVINNSVFYTTLFSCKVQEDKNKTKNMTATYCSVLTTAFCYNLCIILFCVNCILMVYFCALYYSSLTVAFCYIICALCIIFYKETRVAHCFSLWIFFISTCSRLHQSFFFFFLNRIHWSWRIWWTATKIFFILSKHYSAESREWILPLHSLWHPDSLCIQHSKASKWCFSSLAWGCLWCSDFWSMVLVLWSGDCHMHC